MVSTEKMKIKLQKSQSPKGQLLPVVSESPSKKVLKKATVSNHNLKLTTRDVAGANDQTSHDLFGGIVGKTAISPFLIPLFVEYNKLKEYYEAKSK